MILYFCCHYVILKIVFHSRREEEVSSCGRLRLEGIGSMDAILRATIDLIGMAIIVVIFAYGHKFNSREELEQRLFNGLLLTTAICLLTDIGSWLTNGIAGPAAGITLEVTTFIYFLAVMLTGSLWLLYCDLKLVGTGRLTRRQWVYFIPFLIGAALTITNMRTQWLYYFDAQHSYCRGPLYPLLTCLFIGAVVYSVVIMVTWGRRSNSIQRQEAYAMVYFVIPLVLSVVLHTFIYGLNLVPVCLSFSLLIIFIQRQEALIMMDNLTKLNNHRAFASSLEQKLANPVPGQQVFLVLADADRFKTINDTFGHSKGNEALVKIADALKSTAQRSDLVARLGGDEFTIIGQRTSEEEVLALCRQIDQAIAEENEHGGNPYTLSVSWGYALYDAAIHANADQLIHAADQAMYGKKRA